MVRLLFPSDPDIHLNLPLLSPAAVRLRGEDAVTNYHIAYYKPLLAELRSHAPAEIIGALRKMSRGGTVQPL